MSKTSTQEAALKKKLQYFLADLVKVGSTNGFKHFTCYIRGKEELVISIKNSLPSSTSTGHGSVPSQPSSRKQSLKNSDSFSSSCLPYDKSSLTLSHNTQIGLSGMRDAGIGLPPASPSEMESTQDEDVTNFLIAGYSRYSCPYVWIRSNHQRLMKMGTTASVEKDSPLRLKTTARWLEGDVYVYEIIAELVKLCMYPAPRNPFELDFSYFRNLSQPYQCLMSAGMISFLDNIITHSQDSSSYSGAVFQEHQLLSKLHFTSLYDLIESGTIPILKQLRQTQQQSRSRQSSTSSTSSVVNQRRRIHPSTTPTFPSPQHYASHATSSPTVQSTNPVNTSRSLRYGQGPAGAFPGGFDRMPAPSMF